MWITVGGRKKRGKKGYIKEESGKEEKRGEKENGKEGKRRRKRRNKKYRRRKDEEKDKEDGRKEEDEKGAGNYGKNGCSGRLLSETAIQNNIHHKKKQQMQKSR